MAIPLTCPSCEHDFKVKDELAGKRIKCPKCKEIMKVQLAEEEPELEEEEEERPKKKKKKKKKDNRLLIGSAIGGGALIVIAILVFVLTRGSDAGPKPIVQAKKPTPPPVAKIEEPEEEPKPAKKGPASSAGRLVDRLKLQNALRQIGIAYTDFDSQHKRGPKDVKELGIQANEINEFINDKTITFIWDAKSLRTFLDGSSNTIIAYETDADSIGNRIILFADGSVHTMDEATFQKAPKAKGK